HIIPCHNKAPSRPNVRAQKSALIHSGAAHHSRLLKLLFSRIPTKFPRRNWLLWSFFLTAGRHHRPPMSPTWPAGSTALKETNGKITMTLNGVPINATEEERKTSGRSRSVQQGFKGTLDGLDTYPSDLCGRKARLDPEHVRHKIGWAPTRGCVQRCG